MATDASDLILPAIQALANDNVLVIVTTGGQPIDNLGLDSMPANVRVEKFIPYEHLLPHVDVMVTNAGFNGGKLQTPYFQGFWGLGFGKILNSYLKGGIKGSGIMCGRLFRVKANT